MASAVAVVVSFWIVARILEVINRTVNSIVLEGFVTFLDVVLPIIVVLALVIGYLILTVRFLGTQPPIGCETPWDARRRSPAHNAYRGPSLTASRLGSVG